MLTKFFQKITNIKSRKPLIFWLIILCLSLTISFFALQKKPKIMDGSRIKIVDNIGENFLIRGTNPFTIDSNGKRIFNYNDLKKYINQTLENRGFKPLDDFYLIDISLLNLDAYFQIKQEQKFFADNPHLGETKNHSEISPLLLLMPFSDYKLINKITQNYHQNLSVVIQEIHDKLLQTHSKPVIIYVHCNAGRDRTGVLSAGYRMLYKNMNLQQALQQNIQDVGRNPEYFLKDTVISYCHYIKNKMFKHNNFCLNP